MLNQNKTPIASAIKHLINERIVPFDVPGHKRGRGNPDMTEFFGEACVSKDFNSMKALDNISHPISVIKEAEELAAEAFGAGYAFFMVNGTSSAVQNMIFSVCKKGDKIIMPRNVHLSAINAVVLCGAYPIYVNPSLNNKLGIALGMAFQEVKDTIDSNFDAKAIFLNNPTYYGICSNLKRITEYAHQKGMKVLVDEAHGTHFYFYNDFPISAMKAGADYAAVSMHKSGGSLTQSSFLLISKNINHNYVRKIINLTQTTSASYILLAGLDIARKRVAMNGQVIFRKAVEFAQYARKEINKLGGYYAFSKELIDNDKIFDFDITKLSINTLKIGLAGIEVYDLLRDKYGIQLEFGDLGNFLAYISMGERKSDIERLISSLSEIKRLYKKEKKNKISYSYVNPTLKCSPQEAFYSPQKSISIKEAKGYISSEFVMCYPPGIPIVAPGEYITKDIIDLILYSKDKGCKMTGTEDENVELIKVML